MNNKAINLSPKILKGVSIISIILIICNVVMDVIYEGLIKYDCIVPLIALFIFCEYFRKKR